MICAVFTTQKIGTEVKEDDDGKSVTSVIVQIRYVVKTFSLMGDM